MAFVREIAERINGCFILGQVLCRKGNVDRSKTIPRSGSLSRIERGFPDCWLLPCRCFSIRSPHPA